MAQGSPNTNASIRYLQSNRNQKEPDMFDLYALMGGSYRMTAAEKRLEDLRRDVHKMEPVPWDPKMPFSPGLNIRAGTYTQPSLFKVKPSDASDTNKVKNKRWKLAVSPDGKWCYRERAISAGGMLDTISGSRRGVVRFDGDALIPMLHQKRSDGKWMSGPWMSFTPLEFFTLRPGTKLAKGHTIVAGLGMGYQLEQVCKKRSVTKVTLIEIDQELVDWILPQLDLNGKEVKVIIGDAEKLLLDMKADVALVDIYKSYGSNGDMLRWNMSRGVNKHSIGKLWIWGSASIG